jgi:hypothetical protein
LDVHLYQGLLHPLHPTGLLQQQDLALAHDSPHHTHRFTRAPRRTQQTQTHQLLQPLAVLYIALASGHVLHLPRIDQPDLQPATLQHFVHRDPVHPGRLQRYRIYAARQQPIGERIQVVGHRPELTHRFLGTIGRHRHPVARGPDINPGRVGKHLVVSLAHRHGLLHYR